ncbi:MAG: glycosyltransferase [Acidimicrobiia bacterium]|nr:glycosyltransferase [Acidimicrobiia bacterium]
MPPPPTGFFAFELARRGAAEVVSVDLADASRQDWQRPPTDAEKLTQGRGRATQAFEVVRDALGLDVDRVDCSLYDLSPDQLGRFDFVFMGNILLHLADPARALRALPHGHRAGWDAPLVRSHLAAHDRPAAPDPGGPALARGPRPVVDTEHGRPPPHPPRRRLGRDRQRRPVAPALRLPDASLADIRAPPGAGARVLGLHPPVRRGHRLGPGPTVGCVTTSTRPTVVDQASSRGWVGDPPEIAALVATYGRPQFLDGVLAALEAQDLDPATFEVVVVDNGSTDETWSQLERWLTTTPLRALGVRMSHNHGPAAGRNAGAALVRAPLLAITDDDCLPTPGWLRNLTLAFTAGADVVQGAVHADPAGRDAMGPWDHTKWIRRPTPFFETCNVAYRREHVRTGRRLRRGRPAAPPAERTGLRRGRLPRLAGAGIRRLLGVGAERPRPPPLHPVGLLPLVGRPAGAGRLPRSRSPLAARGAVVHRRRVPRPPLRAVRSRRRRVGGRRRRRATLARAGRRAVAAPAAAERPHPRRSQERDPEVLARLAWSDTVALAAMARGSIRHRKLVL